MAPKTSPDRAQDEEIEALDDDRRFEIHGVSFAQYEAVREALDHLGSVRMTYVDGMLELMSPGKRHEEVKKLVARLVELFALERDVKLYGYGNMTFKRKAKKLGLEPDECWCVGSDMREGDAEHPDVAFEVITSSGAIDKLELYQRLGVPEVWFWKKGAFTVHRLGKKGYVAFDASARMPTLDFALLAKLVNSDTDQDATVRAFRDMLRK